MSEKQMEKNLSYGDCFNFIGSLFSNLLGDGEVKVDKEIKKDYYKSSRRHTLGCERVQRKRARRRISFPFLLR